MNEADRNNNREYYHSKVMANRGVYKSHFIKCYQSIPGTYAEKMEHFLDDMCELSMVARFCGGDIKKMNRLNGLIRKWGTEPQLILNTWKHYYINDLEGLLNVRR